MTTFKKIIIKYLLAFAILLLLINISIDVFKKKEIVPSTSSELSVIYLENSFWQVLDNYGINANWVKKKKNKIEDEDSITAKYLVSIPSDIPIPLVVKELYNSFPNGSVKFNTQEKKMFGETELNIISGNNLKLKAILTPVTELKRNKSDLSFIISDALNLSQGNYSRWLNVNFPLSCSVVPDPDMMPKCDSLAKYYKEYTVLLNDDISYSKMKFVPEYSKTLLKGSVSRVLSSFPKRKAVLVDEKAGLYNSAIYNFVRDEFARNNQKLVRLNQIIRLEMNDELELTSRFNFYCNDTTSVKNKIFFTTFDNFEKLLPLIDKYKKKGSKIISVSKSGINFLTDGSIEKSRI